ncbi:insulinase family protein [Parashewanella spongiae]|uniref:Insulinase family protein n=1 Tax=Parashewanella spongiae TaxID=342950 RepID=A0A3A6TZC7_9GAMM|nr:pitrilysin family protein [Parashewanella spongiae]MCL1079823.1 insulinase family protein [Parashewanella spongiae]RJY06832.1 insulinase family protein [Parashewanella spongiae]
MKLSPLSKQIKSCWLVALVLGSSVALSACNSTPAPKIAEVAAVDTGSFSLPQYEQYQLANGLTVYLMPQKEVPLITIDAVVRAGSVNDILGGEARLTAKSLMLGAGGKTKAEIEQAVDFLGASLGSSAGKEGSYLSSDFMAKDLDVMLPIISSVLTSPDFDSKEFTKLKEREIAGLSQAKESPRSVIGRYFDKLIFADHAYGKPSSGNRDGLKKQDISRLKRFYQSYYQPQNTAITVVGDFDKAAMKAKLKQAFGQWEMLSQVSQPNLAVDLPELDRNRVLLVNKGDAIETTFLIGGKGVAYDNADLVGLTVVNTILGGRFTSWLNDELRVNAGLTYGARSAFIPYSKAGVFRISTFTKSDTTEAAIDLALETYSRLWEQGVDQATLDSAKAYVKGQFPPKYETNGQLAGLLTNMYLYGFDDSYINDFQAKVDGLTIAETKRLVSKYFPQDNLQYVLIGNADNIGTVAAKYGTVTQVDIKDIGFDVK